MKRLMTFALLFMGLMPFIAMAQENHGNTLNLGLGIGGYSGYYGYIGHSIPVLHADYEFNVSHNFTLAPFANFYTYTNNYNWNSNYYTYRETVIPIGGKATYYFDELLKANSKWDFYVAGSLGFAIVSRHWEAGYGGNTNYYRGGNSLFLDLHIGTEYHVSNRMGVFLDLSTGVSTIGLAFR